MQLAEEADAGPAGTIDREQPGRAPLFRYANRIVLIRRQYRNLCHVSNRPGLRASRRIELTATDLPRCGAARIDSFWSLIQ